VGIYGPRCRYANQVKTQLQSLSLYVLSQSHIDKLYKVQSQRLQKQL
jgi:hypothetical protein